FPPIMTRDQTTLEQIFEMQIRTLALTLRPSTVDQYRYTARQFLSYLRAAFPQLRRLSQLRRDPHLLGWFRSLSERQPPLCTKTRIDCLVILTPFAKQSSFQRPPYSARSHSSRRLSSRTSLSSQTSFPAGGSTLAAGIAPYR